MFKLTWMPDAWHDYVQLQQEDKRFLKKLNAIIDDTLRHPEDGLGKPERLKANMSGMWSRRITSEHRLVYVVESTRIIVIQCRTHYKKA